MAKKDYSEKRKFARIDLRSKINFILAETTKDENPHKRFHALGKNIGVEGMLFSSDKELKKGTILALEIFLPYQSEPVYLQGEVRWSQPYKQNSKTIYDTGVKFLTIDKNHVMLLVKHVCGSLGKDIINKLDKK